MREFKKLYQRQKFERLVKLHKGKITKKHTGSHKRHKEGHKITSSCFQVSEDKWNVKSTTLPDTDYQVTKIHTCTPKCNLMCRECVCCLSAYHCTCHDFVILNNICKHIHAVNIALKNETFSGPLHAIATNVTSITPKNTNKTSASIADKDCILDKINALYAKTQSKTYIDPVAAKQILSTLNSVEMLLNIDKLQHAEQNITNNSKEPINKKIVPQKRFFSTKKQRAKKPKLNKPSREEQLNATNALLNKPYISMNPQNDHAYVKLDQ